MSTSSNTMAAASTLSAQQDLRRLHKRRTLLRLLPIPLAAAGVLVAFYGVGDSNPWVAAALAVFTASMMFCGTSALHEAAHHTLFRSTPLNVWTGRLLATIMFTPYSVYREVHIRHHAYLNRPEDWELWPYTDPNASLTFRRVFVWFDLCCGLIAGPIIYGRMYFHRDSPIDSPKTRRTIRNEYFGIGFFWGVIWAHTTWAGDWPEHLRGALLPMYLAAVMQTARKLTEHLGMASFDPLLGTRTVLPHKWLLKLSSFMNFDIFVHGPHHRHPRLAHTSLRKRIEDYQRENPEINYPTFDRYWRASLDMLPTMFVNPGCGINAGASANKPFPTASVDDFASDAHNSALAGKQSY